jgi:zinc protease
MTNRILLRAALAVLAGTAALAPAPAPAQTLDRTVMPAPGPTPEVDFPEPARHTLSNGLRVWLLERPGVQTAFVQLMVEAGAVADPADRPGLASLTAAMLTEGTATRSSRQILEEIDFLAANLNANAGQEVSSLTLTTLSRNLAPALAVFADVAVNPSFPDSEWNRVREQRLVAIRQAMDQPANVAQEAFARLVYGAAHPLGRPIQGTPASVRAITPNDLRAFYRARYRPENSHLIVVGDVRADQVIPQLERAFAGWQRGSVAALAAPAAPTPLSATKVYLIDRPDAAQSQIRIGHVGVERANRDYFPLLVMNTILGAAFTSRINLNLREEKGYTYGARSGFQMGRLAGPFTATGGVHTAVTKESVTEFMRELEEIRGARPVTPQELEFAKASIIRREPMSLETNEHFAGRIQEMILYGLPMDYFDEYNARVAAVTLDDVNRVAREYLQPGRFAIVVVGDRAKVEAGLRELPYPLELITLDTPADTPAAAPGTGGR